MGSYKDFIIERLVALTTEKVLAQPFATKAIIEAYFLGHYRKRNLETLENEYNKEEEVFPL